MEQNKELKQDNQCDIHVVSASTIRYSWKNGLGKSLTCDVIEGSTEHFEIQEQMEKDKKLQGGYSSFRKLYLR